ncbi:MAG: hypothetical protein M3Y29_01540 [Chloroflexota bacterium]|nr:hypothetical protein [Chloroflexota bacterium]
MNTNWRRSTLGLLLVAMITLAACTTQAVPTPEPSTPSSPTAPATPPPSEEPSQAPSEQPEPSAPPTVDWEAADVPDTRNASGVVSIVPGGDGFVAIGFDGGFGSFLWTSADGRAWRDVTPAGFESFGIASVVEHDGMLIGVGRGNTIDVDAEEAAVYLSEDGLEWRKVETAEQLVGQMIDVVSTDDGLYAVGGVPGADSAGIWHSTDGETWTRTGGDFEHSFMWAIAEGGPGLVAVGWRRNPDPSAAVWTSPDGVEWTMSPDPEGFELFEGTDVLTTDDGTLVMVGSSFTGQGGQMWFSEDGVDWELAEVAGGLEGRYARTAVRTPAGIIAVGGSEEMAASAWISTDGRSWEPLGEPHDGAYFNAAYVTDDGLLAMGATQAGAVETGIEAYAMIWTAALDD